MALATFLNIHFVPLLYRMQSKLRLRKAAIQLNYSIWQLCRNELNLHASRQIKYNQ